MEKIKVLIVTGRYPPVHSGAGIRTHRTYKRLKEKYNVEILVITTFNKDFVKQIDLYEGIPIYRIKQARGILTQFLILLKLFLKKDINSYKVVHCVGENYLNIAAGVCAKLFSKKLIMERTIVDRLHPNTLAGKVKNFINYFRFRGLAHALFIFSDLVIALNNRIKNQYIEIGVSTEKIFVRHNPVDVRQFRMPSDHERKAARDKYKLNDTDVVHLILGGFNPRKNQRFAVKYLKRLHDNHKLILAGPTYDKYDYYYNALLKDIKENNVDDRVKLLPGFHNDVVSLYHAADVFCLPSLNEGTPNVILEALCCGIPVIINYQLGMNDIVIDCVNGWNIPLDEKMFSQIVQNLELENSLLTKRRNISNNASRLFNANIIDKVFYEKLKSLYK